MEKAGGKGLFVRMDVTREEEIAALVGRTVERFGRLDFAFNNAGIGGEAGAGIANTGEAFDRIFSTNVRSVFFGMKHQIPAILRSGGGAIVNNASVLGLRPSAGSPIYTASKFAVVGLTKSAALEFATKGVRVNAVCAAIIETDLTEQVRENDRSGGSLLANIQSGGLAGPRKSPQPCFTFARQAPHLSPELHCQLMAATPPDEANKYRVGGALAGRQ